jgi:biotin carboxyl carrier protein
MKMEHALTAAAPGLVETLGVAVGEQVGLGQLLLTVAHDEDG